MNAPSIVALAACLLLLPALESCDSPREAAVAEADHSFFAAAWNKRIEKIRGAEKFYLSADGKGAAKALNEWAASLARPLLPEQERELERLRKEADTVFQAYADYKKATLLPPPPPLNDSMSDLELAEALNGWLGVKSGGRVPDYPADATARRLAYGNSLCAYFLNHRKELRRRGIDTALDSCEELSTGGAYPWLDSLVKE